jgi:sulfite reductase (NADPH) flavoprotein alpha-component
VKQYAEITAQDIPATRMNLLDLLKIYPVKNAAQFEEIILKMNALSPRLYTIASSPLAHPDEIHLTVKTDEFTIDGELKTGLCTGYLEEQQADSEFSFFIQKNKRFRLPADDKDIIMIGPGTGIAAFRSFLAERDSKNATGRNWLFFGEQHFATDFLYQTEIQGWYETGLLTKVSLAFSRDQEERIYVQHRMLQQATELYEWISSGAYIYVCGTKDPMSIDVEKTLLQIVSEKGSMTNEEAAKYLSVLKEEGRYEKDVY